MKGGVSAEVPTTFAPDDDEERRSTLLLRDEWSSLRVPSAATTSLAVWTNSERVGQARAHARFRQAKRQHGDVRAIRSDVVHLDSDVDLG